MLDLTQMSSLDAQHNLEVLRWLLDHQKELQAISSDNTREATSMQKIIDLGGFNAWRQTEDESKMMSISSHRFLPVEISVFSDDISLHPEPYPIVSLTVGESTVYPDGEDDLTVICRSYNIESDEKTWKMNDPFAK